MSLISARYPGVCHACGFPVRPGQQVYHSAGTSFVRHANCQPAEPVAAERTVIRHVWGDEEIVKTEKAAGHD